MNTLKVLFTLFILSVTCDIYAQNLRVVEMNFSTEIEDRQPVSPDTLFAADVGTIYCHTLIKGATDTTEIEHVWHHMDEERARIPLKVASDNWRTWSSKSILESWTGRWRVMVENSNGEILATKTFVIKE